MISFVRIPFVLSTFTLATAESVSWGNATISNPKARPTGRSLGALAVAHWKWLFCGGDGNAGHWFIQSCPQQVGVPKGWTFLASDDGECTVSSENYILIPVVFADHFFVELGG